MKKHKGFTLIELLVVIVLIALLFATVMPISYNMVQRYKAAVNAQEIMLYVSALRRDSFLYGEKHLLSSRDNVLTVDGKEIPFEGVHIKVENPITFFNNGATTSGRIRIIMDGEQFLLSITSPLGTLNLKSEEKAS